MLLHTQIGGTVQAEKFFTKVILLKYHENSHWKLCPTSTHIWYQCNKICNTLKLTFHGFWNDILKLICEAWINSLNFLFEVSPQMKIAHS